ncbi:MAG: hypothetical protein ACFCVD_12150 [Nodosilinea sp.]
MQTPNQSPLPDTPLLWVVTETEEEVDISAEGQLSIVGSNSDRQRFRELCSVVATIQLLPAAIGQKIGNLETPVVVRPKPGHRRQVALATWTARVG